MFSLFVMCCNILGSVSESVPCTVHVAGKFRNLVVYNLICLDDFLLVK